MDCSPWAHSKIPVQHRNRARAIRAIRVCYAVTECAAPRRCIVVGQFDFKCRMGGARLIYGSVWAKPTLWSWFICYFTSVNVVTRMVFFFDKRMAGGKNVVRVPEDALFLLAAGGRPAKHVARDAGLAAQTGGPHSSGSSLYGLALSTEQ